GSIMALATKDVLTIPPTSTIKSAIEVMMENRFRRLPVADPGTDRLLGMLGSSAIEDLIGGGGNYQFISKGHRGNFLSAINDSVRRIMNREVLTLDKRSSAKDAIHAILSSKRGGVVVVDRDRIVQGIVTERDLLKPAMEASAGKEVSELMTERVISATPGTSVGDAAKIMIRNSFRRIPIVSEDRLVGLVTTRTLVNFIGRNGAFHRLRKNDMEEVLNTRVSDVMSHTTASVERDAPLRAAIDLMLSTGEGTVCVVEGDQLAGILTERDVVKTLAA
ncbi:MAG: CBS domain-containing protein, partial [Methanobacteriota archaeon]